MTSTIAGTPSSHVRLEDLKPLLPRLSGQIAIITAPPGSGKSTAMYQLVAQMVAEGSNLLMRATGGRPYRVLWAVHGLYGEDSLGTEAVQKLSERLFMRGGVKLLRDRKKMSSAGAYQAQFVWSDDLFVCVLSHAHLPYLLAPAPPKYVANFMEAVDLIVVDEDPLFSMTYSSTESNKNNGRRLNTAALQALQATAPLSVIESALLDSMKDGVAGKFHHNELLHVRRPIDKRHFVSLTGKGFWQRLLLASSLPTSDDFKSFSETLLKTLLSPKEGTPLAHDIVKVFEEDWRSALVGEHSSHRFGLTWEKDKPETMQFRCDVLRPITPQSPPIVILDAYAEASSQQYQLMFPQHLLEFHSVQEPIPLQVEYHHDLSIDLINLTKGEQKARRNHVLATVGELGNMNDAGVLVLSYKKVNRYLSQGKLRQHLYLLAPTLRENAVAWAHWYAGRGVNKFSGRHVVALHPPERPRMFEHHQLAALAPHDAARRKDLARHLRDTELLQMLHRGRQTTFPLGDPQRPRVIVAFKNPVTDSRWVLPPSTSMNMKYRSNTDNPHHRHAVGVLVSELNTLLGAVPHICLVVLGLYKPTKREGALMRSALAALKSKARSCKRQAPHLHDWKGNDHSAVPLLDLRPYQAMDGTHVNRVLASLQANPDLTGLQSWSVRVSAAWGGGQTRVYATTQGEAEEAIRQLGGLP